MKILVLGGDGYLGWPTALHLSAAGHQVAVADNFARRGYDHELGVGVFGADRAVAGAGGGVAGADRVLDLTCLWGI